MKAFQTFAEKTFGDPPMTIRLPDIIRFEADDYIPVGDEAPMPPLPDWDHATERIEWDRQQWRIVPLKPEQLAAKQAEAAMLARKTWPNASAFLSELTNEELGPIANADDSLVQALLARLYAWTGEIASDEPAITGGLQVLVAKGLISAERAKRLLSK